VLRSVHQRDLEIVTLRKTIGSLEDEVSRYQHVMVENRQLQERANIVAGLGPLEDDELNELFGRGGQAPYEDSGLGLVDEASRDRIRELRTKLDRLMREAQFQRDGFQQVLEVLREDQELRDGTPSIRPIPEGHGYISSRYGRRPDPFTGEPTMHRGLDFSAPVGTPVRAPASGRVKHASRGGSLGMMVELDHSNGLITRYGHLSELLVEKGDWVTRGQIVARVGNTGRSTGPHLHYEVVQNGRSQNPWLYIVRD
jgi:murein DD-endopeptidase MepM/ murein hydrolase activator NlpD